jgi:hypothetical protein
MVWGSFHRVDAKYAEARLSSASLLELFNRMPRMEKNHGIAVCKALEHQGFDSPDLLIAALLHDTGKVEHFPKLWERVYAVLIEYVAPHIAENMAQGSPQGFKRALVVRRAHADWGANLARLAGASFRTVSLIRSHHSAPGDDIELFALQAVDDNN